MRLFSGPKSRIRQEPSVQSLSICFSSTSFYTDIENIPEKKRHETADSKQNFGTYVHISKSDFSYFLLWSGLSDDVFWPKYSMILGYAFDIYLNKYLKFN